MGFFDHRRGNATLGSLLGDIGRGAKKIGQSAIDSKRSKPRSRVIGRPAPITHSKGVVGHKIR